MLRLKEYIGDKEYDISSVYIQVDRSFDEENVLLYFLYGHSLGSFILSHEVILDVFRNVDEALQAQDSLRRRLKESDSGKEELCETV